MLRFGISYLLYNIDWGCLTKIVVEDIWAEEVEGTMGLEKNV